MDTYNRKIIASDFITISELGILFLELKYKNISMTSYGTYQNRIRIINEYFGNVTLNSITQCNIKEFEYYLINKKKWKYIKKPSNYSVKMIINTLREELNKAISWNLIKEIPQNKNTNIVFTKDESQIKNINELLIELEQKRALNKIESIFKL
ncbi:MAG: hypothetical protein HFJ46_04925 [Clostridia bacterium]|nr:hypothetical protein [Clostridia bacterium]